MLFFAARPDKAFEEIVLTGLTGMKDILQDPDNADEVATSFFDDRVLKVFSRKDLLVEIERMIEAHSSKKLFSLSDYHFLVLHEIIESEVNIHNDCLVDGRGGHTKISPWGKLISTQLLRRTFTISTF